MEISKIVKLINYRKSILIIGEEGIGKTTLLRNISRYYRNCLLIGPGPPSYLLKSIANTLEIEKKRTNIELLEACKQELHRKSLLLLIDDAEVLTKTSITVLKELKKQGLIIIAGSSYEKDFGIFNEIIKLKRFSKGEIMSIAEMVLKQKFSKVSQGLLEDIAEIANGIPGKAVSICSDITKGYELGEVDIRSRGSVIHFLSRFQRKKSLFSYFNPYILSTIASLCFISRYIFYLRREFKFGYMFAIAGYIALSVYRILRYRKKK